MAHHIIDIAIDKPVIVLSNCFSIGKTHSNIIITTSHQKFYLLIKQIDNRLIQFGNNFKSIRPNNE